MMEIEIYIIILHIVHHYIHYNKINVKNRTQYIFQILSKKNYPNLAKNGHFCNFHKKTKTTRKTRLSTKKLVNSNEWIAKKGEKPLFLANFGQFLAKMGNAGIFQKSA